MQGEQAQQCGVWVRDRGTPLEQRLNRGSKAALNRFNIRRSLAERAKPGAGKLRQADGHLEHFEVAPQLERRHLRTVICPFLALIGQHVVEHLLAEGFSNQLRLEHVLDGVLQA